jgi:hypothetical protein
MNVPRHNWANANDRLVDLFSSTRHSPHRNRQEEYEGSSCDFSPKPINVARYYAEKQTVLDKLNIELESVVAEVAEPEDKHDGRKGSLLSSTTSNKASHIRRLRRARCVDDFVNLRHQR